MNGIEIEPIPCLKDNYAYLISRADSADAYVVDPSEAEPIVTALQRRSLTLRGILATHHHADHVGGIADLVARAGAGSAVRRRPCAGPRAHPGADRARRCRHGRLHAHRG